MKKIHLLTVGKLRDKNIQSLEINYSKRINDFSLIIHELKAHEENLDKEAQEVLKKITDISKSTKPLIFLLTERGIKSTSKQLSQWLFQQFDINDQIILIIGGASGHGQELYELAHGELSLSALTFPHQLARLILIEQLYRAQSIKRNHPYHK